MWRVLLFAAVAFGASRTLVAESRIVVIPVIDSVAANVGAGCESSWGLVRDHLRTVSTGRAHRIAYWETPGRLPTRADIKALFLQAFQPNDVLWFHFCGHGETAPGTGHVLKMPGGDLARSDLRRWMESRGTQGVLITTDACATKGTYDPQTGVWGQPAPPIGVHWPIFEQLIGELHGTVDITASTGETPAFVDEDTQKSSGRGAIFTHALLDTLKGGNWVDLDGNGRAEWDEAYLYLREKTRQYFNDMKTKMMTRLGRWEGRGADDQIPEAFALGRYLRPINDTGVGFVFSSPGASGQDMRFLIRSVFNPQTMVGKKVFVGTRFRDAQNNLLPARFDGFSWRGSSAVTVTGDITNEQPNRYWELNVPRDIFHDANGIRAASYEIVVHDLTDNKTIYHRQFGLGGGGIEPRTP